MKIFLLTSALAVLLAVEVVAWAQPADDVEPALRERDGRRSAPIDPQDGAPAPDLDEPAPEPGVSNWRPDEPEIRVDDFDIDDDDDLEPRKAVGMPAPAKPHAVPAAPRAAMTPPPASSRAGAPSAVLPPPVAAPAPSVAPPAPGTPASPAQHSEAAATPPGNGPGKDEGENSDEGGAPASDADDPASRTWDHDRRDQRAHQLALPDEYLDPSWPGAGAEPRIPPEQSDNVENVPLGDEELDDAEREEVERYKEALGLYKDPDEFAQDNWGENPAERTRERDIEEYEDPAEW